MRAIITGIVTLFILAAASFATPVEVSNPVAGFLRRLEEKGAVPMGFWSTLPRDEAEVAGVLQKADAKKESLNSWDRRRLEKYLNEFDPVRKKNGTVLRYEDSGITFHGSVEYFTGVYLRDSVPSADLRAFGAFTPSLEATYHDKAYLTSSVSLASERVTDRRFTTVDNYNPQNGLPFNVAREGVAMSNPNVITFDAFRIMIGSGTAKLGLEAGQDWNQWGPGKWQHTTLSDRTYFWVSDSLGAWLPGEGWMSVKRTGQLGFGESLSSRRLGSSALERGPSPEGPPPFYSPITRRCDNGRTLSIDHP